MILASIVEDLGTNHARSLLDVVVLLCPKGVSDAVECAPSVTCGSAPAVQALDYQRAEPAVVVGAMRRSALARLARIDASDTSAAVKRPQPSCQNLHENHGLLRYHA